MASQGYSLDFKGIVDVKALTSKAKRNKRKQIQMLNELQRFAARHNDVEFTVYVAGSLDAMNNFRKKYMRYLRARAEQRSNQTVKRLSGYRTPLWSGQTRRSSDYRITMTGSQRFDVRVWQDPSRRGYEYIGPLHDSGQNRTGHPFWFQAAADAWINNMQGHVNAGATVMRKLLA